MEQSMFATELKNVKRQNTLHKKKYFSETKDYFLMERKRFLMLLEMVYFYSKQNIYTLVISKEY